MLEVQVQPSPSEKVEMTTMHQAIVSLLFIVIAMFPCFLAAAPE
jgi:hypothetical protein